MTSLALVPESFWTGSSLDLFSWQVSQFPRSGSLILSPMASSFNFKRSSIFLCPRCVCHKFSRSPLAKLQFSEPIEFTVFQRRRLSCSSNGKVVPFLVLISKSLPYKTSLSASVSFDTETKILELPGVWQSYFPLTFFWVLCSYLNCPSVPQLNSCYYLR